MKKILQILQFRNDMGCVIILPFFVFSLLFAKYISDIYLSMLDFNHLCKFNSICTYKITEEIHVSSCKPKEEWPHAGLYNYNGRQIKPFYMKWFNSGQVNGTQLKFLRLVLVCRLSCKFNNLRTSKQTKVYQKSNAFNLAYQQRIPIVVLFHSKLNYCTE